MGAIFSDMLSHFWGKENVRIVMVGLDAAGKTTILYHLKGGGIVEIIPTTGFNVETVEYKNIRFTIWDLGAQGRLRTLWHHYFVNTQALIFVVDSTDVERIAEAAEELHLLLEREELQNAVVLVLANKQDLANALSNAKMVEHLELHKIKQDWHVQGTSAIGGTGLYDGLEYLQKVLTKRSRIKI